MKNLKNILILFNLWRLETGATFNNLTSLIVKGLLRVWGLEWDWNCKQISLFWNRWGYFFLRCEIQCHHLVDVETCSICLWCALYSAPDKFEFGNQDQIVVFFYTTILHIILHDMLSWLSLLNCWNARVNNFFKNIVNLNVITIQWFFKKLLSFTLNWYCC
jgi:hypothetical protein